VGAEDAAQGVHLVDHHVLESVEEVGPAVVGAEDADVEHVGIGEDDVRTTADASP
jgi:hypothetical protein